MVGEQLGFGLAHCRHPQGSKRIFSSIRGKGNITPHGGWIGRGCAGNKDIESPVPPTKTTLENGHAK